MRESLENSQKNITFVIEKNECPPVNAEAIFNYNNLNYNKIIWILLKKNGRRC